MKQKSLNDKKHYVLSGIGPGPSGVGRLLSTLVQDKRLVCIYPSNKKLILEFNITRLSWWKEIFSHAKFILFKFWIQHFNASDLSVLIIHPQTLKYDWISKLLHKTKLSLNFFIMDCSFFCLRSYNYIPGTNGPCMKCLGPSKEDSIKFSCQEIYAANRGKHKLFHGAMSYFLEKSSDTKVLFQCSGQQALFLQEFPHNYKSINVGLYLDEFNLDSSEQHEIKYDFVFHGTNHPAKGADWAIEFARYYSQYSFYFPFRSELLSSLANVTSEDVSWETGLKDAIQASRICMVPSLWSAPIEGALIKSLALGVKVLVVENPSAFSQELSHENLYRIPYDYKNKTDFLDKILKTPRQTSKTAFSSQMIENIIEAL